MAPRDRKALEREQALSTLALMRREKLSLKNAAKRTGVSPKSVLPYVREGLRRTIGGNYYAKPSDKLSRTLNFLTEQGIISIAVHDSRDATLVSKYMAATKNYLATGNKSFLRPFRGKAMGPYRFVTDTDILDELADAGELEFETIYNYIVGART